MSRIFWNMVKSACIGTLFGQGIIMSIGIKLGPRDGLLAILCAASILFIDVCDLHETEKNYKESFSMREEALDLLNKVKALYIKVEEIAQSEDSTLPKKGA